MESNNTRVAEILNGYFVDITKALVVACDENITNLGISSQDTLQTIDQRFKSHPDIAKIRNIMDSFLKNVVEQSWGTLLKHSIA